MQHVPRYLMSSLLDETIEAVAAGLSTAVYQRPVTPRAPKRRRRTGKPRCGPAPRSFTPEPLQVLQAGVFRGQKGRAGLVCARVNVAAGLEVSAATALQARQGDSATPTLVRDRETLWPNCLFPSTRSSAAGGPWFWAFVRGCCPGDELAAYLSFSWLSSCMSRPCLVSVGASWGEAWGGVGPVAHTGARSSSAAAWSMRREL